MYNTKKRINIGKYLTTEMKMTKKFCKGLYRFVRLPKRYIFHVVVSHFKTSQFDRLERLKRWREQIEEALYSGKQSVRYSDK